MLPFNANLLDSTEYITRKSQFMFRGFLSKMECKTQFHFAI